MPIPHHNRSHRGSCGDGTEVASAPLTLLHCPHAAPPTLPEGLPAMPAGVPMFPVPPLGPGEPAPGFAEPSGPDPAARYPGPGLPPSAPSLQESTHLLRTQDPGGSARCRRRAELNGPPVPGAGRGGACSKALRPGAHGAWRGRGLRRPPPCRLPLSCAWRLRGHRGPLCHRQERCPRTPVREARWRSEEKRIWVASLRMRYWLLPPPCGRGRGPGASLASGQVVLT